MPRCCVDIQHPQTNKTAVFVAVNTDDEAAGHAFASDVAHEAYGKLQAKDPQRHPDNPNVRVSTDEESQPT